MDYDALARQLGGTAAANDEHIDYDAIAQAHGGRAIAQSPKPLTATQAGGAVASGFNRGVFAQLPGLVADTGANVVDLARAAYGTVGRATGFLKPEEMPAPLDRSKVVGSSQWIYNQMQRNPLTAAAVNNPRPDVGTARVLNAGGAALGTSLAGTPANMAMQFGSGALGQSVFEGTGDPNLAMLASLTPQAAVTGAQAGTRAALRGGEQGRRELAQRAQDFENIGVSPTVGLATGKRLPMAIESTLGRTPGAAGTMAAKAASIQDEMQAAANATRDRVSPVYGPVETGNALYSGAKGYRQQQQAIYRAMLDRALGGVPEGMTFPVSNMLARGGATLADIPNAPNVSAVLNQPKQFTSGLLGALNKDAAPQGPTQQPTGLLGASGEPIMREVPGTPGGLPMPAILGLRTRIGELAYANNPLNADANTGALKHLYSGAKQDIFNAGRMADAQRAASGQAPMVLSGLQRADRFYSGTQKVLEEVLAPIYRTAEVAPEKAFGRVMSDARSSGQTVQRLMASMPLNVRRVTAATVIDRLGRANPGAQTAEGDAFASGTFLTNWNKLSTEAKDGIFSGIPNNLGVRQDLDRIAKAAERIKEAGAVYANPSGTAGAAAAYGQAATIGGGLVALSTGHTTLGSIALAQVLTTQALARAGAAAMTHPKFVRWLADTTQLKPDQMQAHLRRLATMANQSRDPQLGQISAELSAELGQ